MTTNQSLPGSPNLKQIVWARATRPWQLNFGSAASQRRLVPDPRCFRYYGRLDSEHNPSPPSSAAPALINYLVPSVADLLFIILLASLSIGALAPRLLGDAGIGWHIRNGEIMLQTHAVTRADPFSSTMNGRPWYAWEWLYDVGIAAVHHVAGLNGVVLVTAFVIALSFFLLFRFLLARGTDLPLAVLLLVLAVGGSAIHLLARPHVVSWLLTLVWFYLIESSESAANSRRLYWLPVIMLLWTNVHGGFLMGFVLLAIYLVDALLYYRENRKLVGKLWVVAGLSFLATFVNPYGYGLHIHVYQYLSNRFLMNHIDEFASPNFHGVGQQCFLLLLLISIAAVAARRERVRTSHLLLMLFAAYSGLYASRNLPLSSMFLVLIAGPILSRAMANGPRIFSRMHAFSERTAIVEARSRAHLWPMLAIVLAAVVFAGKGSFAGRQIMNAHFEGKRFPVEAAAAIETMGLPPTIFAPDYWGGYLIYRFYPRMRVVVDDRHDLYGETFLRQYLATIHLAPDWMKLLDDNHVDWALLPAGSTLANALKQSNWQVGFEDQTSVLLERQGARVEGNCCGN